jgi:hypothetical protein
VSRISHEWRKPRHAQILERLVELIAHLVVHHPAYANPARLGENFQSRHIAGQNRREPTFDTSLPWRLHGVSSVPVNPTPMSAPRVLGFARYFAVSRRIRKIAILA